MGNKDKPTIVLSFQKEGKNGGPYLSHTRIMESGLKEKYNFVPLYIPRSREALKPAVFRSLVEEIKAAQADIFQFTGLQLDGYISYRLGNAAGVTTICAIRGSTDEAVTVNPILRRITDYCEKRTLRGADACYAVSEYVASWEKTKKYANNLFGYIYNFYDFKSKLEARDDRKRIRQELCLKSDDVVIVSTGRITLEKGFGTIKDIILNGKPWGKTKFVIVGDGNYKNQFEKEIQDKGLCNYVLFLGYRSDVDSILNASDIYLSCTWHETFGNSIIEGSYHKLPVIASCVGGVPEIVEDGLSGYLVDYKDIETFIEKIKMLVDDASLRGSMGENGLKYVMDKFDPQSIEARLDGLYQSVLRKRMK